MPEGNGTDAPNEAGDQEDQEEGPDGGETPDGGAAPQNEGAPEAGADDQAGLSIDRSSSGDDRETVAATPDVDRPSQRVADARSTVVTDPDALLVALDALFELDSTAEEAGDPVEIEHNEGSLGQQLAAQDGFANATRQLMDSLNQIV